MTPSRPVVVILRAAEQSTGLVERLEATGYDVVEVPVIAIADAADGGAALAAALVDLPVHEWLVVTSPNGAVRVRDALRACEPGRRPRVAAVGPGTAAALGVPVDLVASSSVGEGLVSDFPAGTGRVLLVQAEAARPVVREGLAAKGWSVDAVVAYRTIAVVPPAAQLARVRSADAVILTSGSTVRGLLAAISQGDLPAIVLSIGPATTAVAAELGLSVAATASVHTLDGLIDALVSLLPPAHGGRRDGRS